MKKQLFYFLVLLIVVTGCSSPTQPKSEIQSIIEKVANKYSVKLSYKEVQSNEGSSPLSLTIYTPLKYKATNGVIVEECYNELSQKGIYFTNYVIKDQQGQIGMEISRIELEKAIQCKSIALKVLNALSKQQMSTVISDLDTVYFKENDYLFLEKYSEENFKGEMEYIGIETAIENDQLYCAYEATINDKFTSVIINLSLDDCKVFGINF